MINFAKHINDFIDPRFDAGGLSADGEAIRWPQIRIQNFPRHVSKSEIDTFFNDTIKIPCRKFKTIPGKTFVFVYFNTEEDMNRALEIINKTTLKGNKVGIYIYVRLSSKFDFFMLMLIFIVGSQSSRVFS